VIACAPNSLNKPFHVEHKFMLTIAITAVALAVAHIGLTVIGAFILSSVLERIEPKPNNQ
jgi:hypothetical protein